MFFERWDEFSAHILKGFFLIAVIQVLKKQIMNNNFFFITLSCIFHYLFFFFNIYLIFWRTWTLADTVLLILFSFWILKIENSFLYNRLFATGTIFSSKTVYRDIYVLVLFFAPLATRCQRANFRLSEIQCLRLSLFKYMYNSLGEFKMGRNHLHVKKGENNTERK